MKSNTAISTPFDSVAAAYDQDFEGSPFMGHLRSVITVPFLRRLVPGSTILELNCGTGTDAVDFARRGFRVIATDSSELMLEEARKKSSRADLGDRLVIRRYDFSNLPDDELRTSGFSAIFSNFGGLNCLSPGGLQLLFSNLLPLLPPGGIVCLCLLNRVCLWEILSFLIRGRVKQAFRRFGPQGAPVRVSDTEQIPVWYYSPADIRNMIRPWAVSELEFGVSIFSPPPNSRRFIASMPKFTRFGLALDDHIRLLHPFRECGDHFIIIARRNG